MAGSGVCRRPRRRGATRRLAQDFGGQAGGHPARLAAHVGELLGATPVPITFEHTENSCRLAIPRIAEAAIEAMSGQSDGPIEILGHPLCVAPGFPARVAKSKSLRYTDHGMSWELSEKNGFFSPFEYARLIHRCCEEQRETHAQPGSDRRRLRGTLLAAWVWLGKMVWGMAEMDMSECMSPTGLNPWRGSPSCGR